MAPLIIVSLGIGMLAKVVIVVVSAFFPIVINTRAGVQSVDRSLHDVSTAFRTSRWERFRFVILPGSIPYVLAGVRLGLGRGLIGLVFGDLFGATAGLGYLLLSAQQNLQTGNVYVAVVIIGLLGLLFGGIVSLLERRFATYRSDPEGSKR
jgi:ABC-type nitrate/sulfonate/bicarbonate transport system permease component